MRFLDPLFLFALVFILIPVLIHFFHFKRYKTIFFSQVGFLKAIKQESKKKNNIKQLLILISRILAITFLVFAFAEPYLPVNRSITRTSQQLIGVYIDNSFSMKKMSENGTLLDEARNTAISIVNSYGPGANFILLSNQSNNPNQQQTLNKEQFISELSKLEESPNNLPLSKAVQQFKGQTRNSKDKSDRSIYLLSDFQKYVSDFEKLEADSNIQSFLIPFKSDVNNNLMVDTCWLETPGRRQGQTETLHVRIQNQSNQTYQNSPVRLQINDTLKAVSTLTIAPDETQEIEFSYRNNKQGIHLARVELDDYPTVFDNTFYFSYSVEKKADVLAIYRPEEETINLLENLFSEDENISFSSMEEKKIQLGQFDEYQCIFLLNLNELSTGLTNALINFVEEGGTLCVFPGNKLEVNSYNSLYSQLEAGSITGKDTFRIKMSNVNYRHPLFNDVFTREDENIELPYLSESYRFQSSTNSLETKIITNNNESTAISEYPFGLGRLYNFSFTLNPEITDFYKQVIFVPVIYNMALNSYEPQTIQYTLSDNQLIELRKNKQIPIGQFITISKQDGTTNQLPVLSDRTDYFRINPSSFTNKAGFYKLTSGEQTIRTLAFNYKREESLSESYSTDEIRDLIKDWDNQPMVIESNLPEFNEVIESLNDGTELWKLFILMGLLFVLFEAMLIRLWK